jgi:hypothetical protein
VLLVVCSNFAGGNEMRLAWAIVAILLIFWVLGIGLHVAGSLIHLLLLVAVVVLIVDLVGGRRRAI